MRLRYYCHFQKTGYGLAALEYALGLARDVGGRGIELDLRPIGPMPANEGRYAELFSREVFHRPNGRPDAVLVHTLPRDCQEAIDREVAAGNLVAGVPAIAYTTWEAITMPLELRNRLDNFRGVLTPSEASMRPMMCGADDPRLHVVHHGYDPAEIKTTDASEAETGIDQPYTFYYLGAMNRRKNIEGLVRAFVHAFAPDFADVRLVLHCPGAQQAQFALMLAGTGHPRAPIVLERDFADDAAMARLHRDSDCYVTASRGEAWGLGSFEAMVRGRHVIAPKGQGSDEYLEDLDRTSPFLYLPLPRPFLYPAHPQPAGLNVEAEMHGQNLAVKTSGPTLLTSKDLWWEPDLRQLASAMSDAANFNFVRGAPISPVARDKHLRRFTQEGVTHSLINSLERILSHG